MRTLNVCTLRTFNCACETLKCLRHNATDDNYYYTVAHYNPLNESTIGPNNTSFS